MRSALGHGSTFTLAVPRVYTAQPPPPEETRAAPAPALVGSVPASSRGQALIIDDEETARYALASRLADLPLDVVEAGDAHDGLRLARELRPAVIFLDLVMPEMLGFEVLERLRDDAATLKVPVVVVTSKVLSPEEEGRLAAQGAAFLAKEVFSLSDAAARIREALVRAGWTAAAEPASQGVRP